MAIQRTDPSRWVSCISTHKYVIYVGTYLIDDGNQKGSRPHLLTALQVDLVRCPCRVQGLTEGAQERMRGFVDFRSNGHESADGVDESIKVFLSGDCCPCQYLVRMPLVVRPSFDCEIAESYDLICLESGP
jgi:hypothetical protein